MTGIALNITAPSVAWYGAVVATLSGIKALSDILNDRGRLKISFQTDMMIAGDSEANDEHIAIRVTNKSKRPAKITHVGLRTLPSWNHALLFAGEASRTLTEEDPATIYIQPQRSIDLEHLWFVYVIDARGKEYHWYKRRYGRIKWYQYKALSMAQKLGLFKRRDN